MSADAKATVPADAKQRKRALDARASFIVQAPAGSGKTALLTRRVLTLLAGVNEPEEILAITFTRKAAAEMRSRVVEALEFAATSERPEAEFEREGYDLAKAVLERDTQLNWSLLENPDRLRMSTIDALCSMLAQQLPVTSTLGGIANTVDDASALYREAARRRLKSDTATYRQLLATVGNRFDKAENLLANMLSNRDQWLPYWEIFTAEDRNELREWLEDQLAELVTHDLQLFEQRMKDAGIEHLFKSKLLPLLQWASQTLGTLELYKPGGKELREPFLGLTDVPELSADNLKIWQSLLTCLFTAEKKKVRKKVTRSEGFPSSKKDIDELGADGGQVKDRRDAFSEILQAVADASSVEAAAANVLALPPPKYADAQWALLEELLTELPALEATLHQVFVDRGAIDFIEIAARAKIALGSPDAPTDLALAMDLRLQHLLVDEFQDTSRSQFALFQQMVAGWQRGDGRTFFVVGDPMQSIYAFRAAEVKLFLWAKKNGISDDVPLEPLTLETNFRSSGDVVNWVNNAFSKIFATECKADSAAGTITYSPSVAHNSFAGSVTVHPLLNQNVDEAGEHVASLVRDILATPDYREISTKRIAILVRSRTAAEPIFVALQRHGIESLSVDMDSLADQPVVMDLVSLTIALRFPHSRLHWLAILRAPWCGLGLEDLHALTSDTGSARALPQLINDAERQEKLSTEGKQRLDKFLAVVQPAIDRAARSSLVSWVEAVWLQLGGPMLCQRAVERDAAERCLKKLYQLEADGELWQPQVIQNAMARLFAITPDDGTAKVHIMTMHKSKGLEFDTVILPGLNRRPPIGGNQLLDWAVVDAEGERKTGLLLAPMTERKASNSEKSLGRLVRDLNSANDEEETQRLLYVACTRAVRQLHLVSPLRVNADGELKAPAKSLLETLWPVVQDEFDGAVKNLPTECLDDSIDDSVDGASVDKVANEDGEETVHIPPLVRVAKDWQRPLLPHYVVADSDANADLEEESHSVDYLWAGRLARAVGTVMHRHMERFHARGLPTVDELGQLVPVIERQLRQQGLAESELAESTQKVIVALQNVTNDNNGRWLYDSSHTEVRAEWALTANVDDRLERRVIDRTFICKEGTRWIVDFKTGDHSGGDLEGFLTNEVERYGPQLRRYAEILSSAHSAPVRLALYFPLLQAFREVPLAEEG